MIKHSVKDDLIHLSIPKKDFSYRLSLKKFGNSIDWKIGQSKADAIVFKDVSKTLMQLMTGKITDEKYIKQLIDLVQENAPQNKIDWELTFKAVQVQNQFNWLNSTKNEAGEKRSEEDVLKHLRERFKL